MPGPCMRIADIYLVFPPHPPSSLCHRPCFCTWPSTSSPVSAISAAVPERVQGCRPSSISVLGSIRFESSAALALLDEETSSSVAREQACNYSAAAYFLLKQCGGNRGDANLQARLLCVGLRRTLVTGLPALDQPAHMPCLVVRCALNHVSACKQRNSLSNHNSAGVLNHSSAEPCQRACARRLNEGAS